MSSSTSDIFQAEYDAFTQGCGYAVLQDWSTVALAGDDRMGFLHNLCTNDIRQLAAGEGCEAFCTDVRGKIVAHVFAIAAEDRLELLSVPEQSAPLIEHLQRYIIREDVQLEDETGSTSWIMLSGAHALELLTGWTPAVASQCDQPWCSLLGRIGKIDCLIVGCNLVWPKHFLLRCQADELPRVCQSLVDAGAVACGPSVWTAVRVESGLPLFGVDFDSSNLPQEISRDDRAISFRKGCYLGQETIARIDALGHVNQQLVRVQFSGKTVPSPGTALGGDAQEVGQITTACWSPQRKSPLALAMVRRGWNEAGRSLDSEFGAATVEPLR